MLKDLLLRKILSSKMKNVPQEEQDKIFALLEKNPEFFQTFATEVQAKISGGQDQMAAVMSVMKKHEDELKKLIK